MVDYQPIVTLEDPPAESRRPERVVDWPQLSGYLRDKVPGHWVRIQHEYSTPGSARSSVQRAATLHGLEYRVTTRSPQEDGRVGVFVRYNPGQE